MSHICQNSLNIFRALATPPAAKTRNYSVTPHQLDTLILVHSRWKSQTLAIAHTKVALHSSDTLSFLCG